MAALNTEVTIKFDARDRRLFTRIVERLDTLIALLTKDEPDGTQEQDSDVPRGAAEGA